MKHTVALSCSYHGKNVENLFRNLPQRGILQIAFVGREITMQVRSENLDEIKSSLKRLGVSNISIMEWKKIGTTLSNSGKGTDNNNIVKISLIPSHSGDGLVQLAFLSESDVDDNIIFRIKSVIEDILQNAGITDVLYTIHIMKTAEEEELIRAVSLATIKAIFDSGGVVNID
ncbi:MAG: hypothetical protein DRO94_00715 [Candidatus Altiarchaeales archaeon]|nr:MAG: hypothetical protein DRO95_02305 [Candidatus Altiarchaeales archaeon]RLI95348.1 MAG: hypothetical protein DRO94_00715 [Candidatus Altiarchaeales archaeon]HDO82562.1 hypothetical protein [Candidatus Altiarchaeales archaeon]HEX55211.1 hypothetical protein [Candidatus Altiarchaeales archaeon]